MGEFKDPTGHAELPLTPKEREKRAEHKSEQLKIKLMKALNEIEPEKLTPELVTKMQAILNEYKSSNPSKLS